MLTDSRLDSRYATTAWRMHQASLRYYFSIIFPDKYVTPQTALMVQESSVAEALSELHNACSLSRTFILQGRTLENEDTLRLYCLTPWHENWPIVELPKNLRIRMLPDRSNLDDLTFEIYRVFGFLGDSMLELAELEHGLAKSTLMSQGWCGIPGVRPGCGALGTDPSRRW